MAKMDISKFSTHPDSSKSYDFDVNGVLTQHSSKLYLKALKVHCQFLLEFYVLSF